MAESNRDVFKISKDLARARDLLEMADERLRLVIKSIPRDITYRILEEYYEISIQIMTALMYLRGYKTLSHISLIKFLSKDYGLNESDLEILDRMRRFRHGTVYYGRKESGNFYINHEEKIKKIVNKLFKIAKKNLGAEDEK
ncbi:MAG: hypothetical protein WDZ69_01120 [Candidatus Pacearchaeota archaeon]